MYTTDRIQQGLISLSKSTEDLRQRRPTLKTQELIKLPPIRTCKSATLLPRRKVGITDVNHVTLSPSNTLSPNRIDDTDHVIAPVVHIQADSERQNSKPKASLAVSRNAVRRHSDNSRPEVVGSSRRVLVDVSPLPRRKFQSVASFTNIASNGRAALEGGGGAAAETGGEKLEHTRSISLDDISALQVSGRDTEDGKWSRHWLYTRKSVGEYPNHGEIQIVSGQMCPSIFSDVMEDEIFRYSDEKTLKTSVLPRLSLEERLSHVERQQGINH